MALPRTDPPSNQVLIRVINLFFLHYLNDHTDTWNSLLQKAIDHTNALTSLVGLQAFPNIPLSRKNVIEELYTDLHTTSQSQFFDLWGSLVLKLGQIGQQAVQETQLGLQQHLKALNIDHESQFDQMIHAIRSYIVGYLKINFPQEFQELVTSLQYRLKESKERMNECQHLNMNIASLVEARNTYLLKLTYLEQFDAYFEANDLGLLHQQKYPDPSFSHTFNMHLPTKLQPNYFHFYFTDPINNKIIQDPNYHVLKETIDETAIAITQSRALMTNQPDKQHPSSLPGLSGSGQSDKSSFAITLDTEMAQEIIQRYIEARQSVWGANRQKTINFFTHLLNSGSALLGYEPWERTPEKRQKKCVEFQQSLKQPSQTMNAWSDLILNLGMAARQAQNDTKVASFSYAFILFHAIRDNLVTQLKKQHSNTYDLFTQQKWMALNTLEQTILQMRTDNRKVTDHIELKNLTLFNLAFLGDHDAIFYATQLDLINLDNPALHTVAPFDRTSPDNRHVPLYLTPDFYQTYRRCIHDPKDKVIPTSNVRLMRHVSDASASNESIKDVDNPIDEENGSGYSPNA
ncbi:MAG: hypothetical protein A3J38_03845 [Gammaproteobacteria bacterium RIFCSPHIGHO2_12_FULL_45_9]|nr:MAG: hypothetical protein A3J38_03845 [Gammaproteobacteria bacterium RIFCSPHIGHO2_12_FULL_45_9]